MRSEQNIKSYIKSLHYFNDTHTFTLVSVVKLCVSDRFGFSFHLVSFSYCCQVVKRKLGWKLKYALPTKSVEL